MNVTDRRAFDHVVIIIFENEYRAYVRQNDYMRSLAAQGIELAGYSGVMHPSNTNYVASIAGEICNISADPTYFALMPAPPPLTPAPLTQTTVADLLAGKGHDWRAYMETYTPVDYPPVLTAVYESDGKTVNPPATVKHTIMDYLPYLNMHNPFVQFQSITGNRAQWQRIGTAYDFLRDCLDRTLPEYSWFTPNVWSNGHWLTGSYDEPPERGPMLVEQLANWLRNFFGVLNFPGPKSRIPPRTLVVVTFDESDYEQNYTTAQSYAGTYDGPAQIYTVLLGDMIKPGRETEGYNHYSLLRTVEQNFNLGDLGKNDAEANCFRFLWGQRFGWKHAAKTPIAKASAVAAAGLDDTLYVVYAQEGKLSCTRLCDGSWSDVPLPAVDGVSGIALAACGGQLMLVCRLATGLSLLTFDGRTWSQPQPIAGPATTAIALASFRDYGDHNTQKLMLAYATAGELQSQTYANGAWSAAVAVGQQTDGDLELAVLGTSLFLIHKAVGTNEMNVVSYNTAPFNVVTNNAPNDTTQYTWSPSEFPVAFFALRPNPSTPHEPEPADLPYQGAGPYAAATLDGVIHLAHANVNAPQVMTETFSLSGMLTPQNVVDVAASATGTSNGWGTLAEAGWTLQTPIEGVANAGALSMARFGSQLALLFQPTAGGAVHLLLGGYS